ncbi:MAG: hypothetical protein AAGB48_08325 [Planctomycetota bacterium]
MTKPVVYMACPYSIGHVNQNVHDACMLWNALRIEGVVIPINPLWSHVQDTVRPIPYSAWLRYDLELIASGAVHAVLRCFPQVESKGADAEIEHAHRLGIPVFFAQRDLYEWAESRSAGAATT